MTLGLAAMLLGIFGVPAVLVWAGHKMRRRSRAWHSAFWGAIGGHLLALVVGLVAAMSPPEGWASDDRARGLLGFWSFLLFPALGAVAGRMRARRPGTQAGRDTRPPPAVTRSGSPGTGVRSVPS